MLQKSTGQILSAVKDNNCCAYNISTTTNLSKNMKSRFFLVVLVTGIFISFWVNSPVPEGLAEPYKYRLLATGSYLLDLQAAVLDVLCPGKGYGMIATRYILNLAQNEPPSTVPGSKFKARETEFDGVTVRLYEPIQNTESLLPGFVFIHGGGYCLGNTKMYDGLTRQFADELNAVVVSVEYRLCPEHIIPSQFEDTLKATQWFISHARDYGVDPTRIGIGGDSAGGHLSALVTQHIHDDPSVSDPKVQLLVYPIMQHFDMKTPSYQMYQHYFGNRGPIPFKKNARFMSHSVFGKSDPVFERSYKENNHTSIDFKNISKVWKILDHSLIPESLKDASFYSLPDDKNHEDATTWEKIKKFILDPRVSPFLRDDFSGLPPTLIQTCGFDSLRDDGIFYWSALKTAGVETKWINYEGGIHGIFWLGGGVFEFDLGAEMRNDAFRILKLWL